MEVGNLYTPRSYYAIIFKTDDSSGGRLCGEAFVVCSFFNCRGQTCKWLQPRAGQGAFLGEAGRVNK